MLRSALPFHFLRGKPMLAHPCARRWMRQASVISETQHKKRTGELRRRFALSEFVEPNRQDDHHTDDDFLNVVGPVHLLGTAAQHGHDEGADDRTGYAARAAAQTRAADAR